MSSFPPVRLTFDNWLGVGRRYRRACVVAIMLGWIAYAPIWDTYFFADDVDFFGGMCRAINQGKFLQWLWYPGNGHVSVLPKLGYYTVWRWFGRDVFWWHVATLLVWTSALVVLVDLFARVFRSRAIGVVLLAVFACSSAYRSQIMTPPAANHLWGACAAAWAFWSAWRYMEGASVGFLAISVVMAIASYLSIASGFTTFLFLIALAMLMGRRATRRRRVVLCGVGGLGALGVVAVQVLVGGTGDGPDLLFGLRETLRGLYRLDASIVISNGFSRLASLSILVYLALHWRQLNVRLMLFGALLMVIPLLFATSFRSQFPGIGNASRYGFVPMIGASVWLGQAFSIAPKLSRPAWFTPRLAAILLCGLFACSVAHAVPKNMRTKARHTNELHQLEQEIGRIVEEYAAARGTEMIAIPRRKISLPVSPDRRPLDYIARYCVDAKLIHRIVGADRNPDFDQFVRRRSPRLWSQLAAPISCDRAYVH